MDDRPIGVFDSGVGGLSVLKAIRQELPSEDVIYVADSGYAPYGDRPSGFIEERSLAIARFLVQRGIKALVVACNTATGAAVHTLRANLALPVIAMEPALKPASLQSKSHVVGVLATASTLASSKFQELVARYGADVQVLLQPSSGLVESVEAGDLSSQETKTVVEAIVRPLLDKGADTLVLGCTHYPFLRPLIGEVAGSEVAIIDPAIPVARELRRRLESEALLAPRSKIGAEEFWSSGDLENAATVMSQLWSHPVSVSPLPPFPGLKPKG